MKKIILLVSLSLFISTSAMAFGLSDIKGWFGFQTLSYILTGFLSIGAIGGGIIFMRFVNTLKEAGEFVVCVTSALADRKISSEELKDMVAQGRDVFSVWKATPDMFKVK